MGGSGGGGGQGGCERKSEVFVKILNKKKLLGGRAGGPIRGWGTGVRRLDRFFLFYHYLFFSFSLVL